MFIFKTTLSSSSSRSITDSNNMMKSLKNYMKISECSTDSRSGSAGSEPHVNLELLFTGFSVGDELEIEVEMLEVASKGSSGSCDLDYLGLDLDFDSLQDVHGLRRQYSSSCFSGMSMAIVRLHQLLPELIKKERERVCIYDLQCAETALCRQDDRERETEGTW